MFSKQIDTDPFRRVGEGTLQWSGRVISDQDGSTEPEASAATIPFSLKNFFKKLTIYMQ